MKTKVAGAAGKWKKMVFGYTIWEGQMENFWEGNDDGNYTWDLAPDSKFFPIQIY